MIVLGIAYPLIAATVRASVQQFFPPDKTPRAHSSRGKERHGKISKQGSKQLRTLLTSSVRYQS
ncbi:transposase [Ensifer aridi]|uniref:transposase n=1 Tax=Ensifer aridi TaxID=1708715 RepID=UPI003B849AE8